MDRSPLSKLAASVPKWILISTVFIAFGVIVGGQGQLVIQPSSPQGVLVETATIDAYNNSNFNTTIQGLTLLVVQGSYPITCDSSTIRLVNWTATDPRDNTGGEFDNIPANTVGTHMQNDAIPTLIGLPYVGVDPSTGNVFLKEQLINGTSPLDHVHTTYVCATTGHLIQNYDVYCLDSKGTASNHVQFSIRMNECINPYVQNQSIST